jgi:hypothetical protein
LPTARVTFVDSAPTGTEATASDEDEDEGPDFQTGRR